MNKYEKTWIRNTPLNQSVRINVYNTVVKPVLLYNCSTWGLTVGDEDKLDAFHRKQLRRVLGKRYPDKISNKNLYETSKSKPISPIFTLFSLPTLFLVCNSTTTKNGMTAAGCIK